MENPNTQTQEVKNNEKAPKKGKVEVVYTPSMGHDALEAILRFAPEEYNKSCKDNPEFGAAGDAVGQRLDNAIEHSRGIWGKIKKVLLVVGGVAVAALSTEATVRGVKAYKARKAEENGEL